MAKKKIKKGDSGAGVDLLNRNKDKQKLTPPAKYNVVFHNDDYTPMHFVVIALVALFRKNTDEAVNIMMQVQEKGKGIAGGPYSKEIAETKVSQVMSFAKGNGHPLKATAEKS